MAKFLIIIFAIISGIMAEKEFNIAQKMQEGGIVPDVIDEIESAKINIVYPNGKIVEFGGELTPTEVKEQPEVHFNASPTKYYTLIMVDPDAPSRQDPKFREVNHWLVANIYGSDIKTGDVITEYAGSGPPKGSGLHRYIFLLFEQPSGKLSFDEPHTSKTSRAHRLNFSVRKFATKYNLSKPIAGNYFHAQWDPYVDERNKHITNE